MNFRKINTWIVVALSLLTFANLLWGIQSQISFLNSDSVQMLSVANDVIDGNLKGTVLGPNPYIFPDLILTIAVRLVSSDPIVFHTLYFLLIVLISVILFKFLLSKHQYSKLGMLMFVSFMVLEMRKFVFNNFFFPGHHYSLMLVDMLLLIIYLNNRKTTNIFTHVIFFFLITLTMFSDPLALSFIVAPMIALVLIDHFVLKGIDRRSTLMYLLNIVMSFVTGFALFKNVNSILKSVTFTEHQQSKVCSSIGQLCDVNQAFILDLLKYMFSKKPLINVLK